MEVILKDGKYTSRELCELCNYSYENFRKRECTLINKLSKVCKITKEKIGNKAYYTLEGSDGIRFDATKRREYNLKHKATDEYIGKNAKYRNILTDDELRENFNDYYVYAHYIDEEVIYIGKGCRSRAIKNGGRKYKVEELTDIKILERFEDEKDALKYEKEMIEFYQSIGQCCYNDIVYHEGYCREKTKDEVEYNKLISIIGKLEIRKEKLKSKKEKLENKISDINDEIKNMKEKLYNNEFYNKINKD